jgi:hypothetical protein
MLNPRSSATENLISWSNRIPILVGVSGRRFFNDVDLGENTALSGIVEQRLWDCFKKLDEEFKDTPKILLTSGAIGTDLLAAKIACERETGWRIAFVLPFSAELMREDFGPPPQAQDPPASLDPGAEHAGWAESCAHWRATFDEFIEKKANELVVVKQLPALIRNVPQGDKYEVKSDAERYAIRDLRRSSPSFDGEARRAHYEQVSQWIAEAATILIAVAEEGAPQPKEANGATPRTIAVRRQGQPEDEAGRNVARRSLVLQSEWSVPLPSPKRYVWLIDPRARTVENAYGVRVLPPADDLRAESSEAEQEEWLADSLFTVEAFEQFNHNPGTGANAWTAAREDAPDYPIDILRKIRGELRERTKDAKGKSHWAFRWLAILFLAAVLLFEAFAKFAPSWWLPILIYLLPMGGIGAVVYFARKRRWQPLYEDYRAVSEMLRVQRAWWAAGLPNRVDREHLRGVDPDLARVRDAVTTMLALVWLRSSWPDDRPMESEQRPLRKWEIVRAGKSQARATLTQQEEGPQDWIGSQIDYFAREQPNRERWAVVAEASSWFLFVTAGVLAFLIFLFLFDDHARRAFEAVAASLGTHGAVGTGAPLFVFVLITAGRVLLRLFAIHDRRRRPAKRRHPLHKFAHSCAHGARGFVVTFVFALFAAPALAVFAVNLGKPLALLPRHEHHWGHALEAMAAAEYVMIVFVVLLNALAGASRFLSERLGWEAEALNFRDMLKPFQLAEAALDKIYGEDDRPRDERDEKQARGIVLELGRLALSDTEAWLKMRRERPLTPVTG